MKLYKVLVDGKSCNGGKLEWSLPTLKGKKWIPGDWHTVEGELSMCSKGIHLTKQPYQFWYKWGCKVFEAEGKEIVSEQEGKVLVRSARLLRECNQKKWERDVCQFVSSLGSVPWCKPDGTPKKEWKLFEAPTLAAAGTAAWDAVGDAAGDVAWAAIGDAVGATVGAAAWDAVGVAARIIAGNKLDKKHANHLAARMEVWRKGYCLMCDVDGVLYVYAKKEKP